MRALSKYAIMLVITSPQNPTIKSIRSLADKKNRRDLGLFTAEGHDMLARARAEGWEPETIVARHQTEALGQGCNSLAMDASKVSSRSSMARSL